jgi:hypothetical protein
MNNISRLISKPKSGYNGLIATEHPKEFIMTIRLNLLSRTTSTVVFVISLLLTAATLNSVVTAAQTMLG